METSFFFYSVYSSVCILTTVYECYYKYTYRKRFTSKTDRELCVLIIITEVMAAIKYLFDYKTANMNIK